MKNLMLLAVLIVHPEFGMEHIPDSHPVAWQCHQEMSVKFCHLLSKDVVSLRATVA